AEYEQPHTGADAADDGRDTEERTARGRDDLPALLEAEEERTVVAEHRSAACEHSDAVTLQHRRDERRNEALRGVEHASGKAELPAVHAADVRRADCAAALRADVLAAEDLHEPEAPRHRAEHVAARDEECVSHIGMAFCAIQPFTTSQSRLSKNAPM